VTEVHVTTGLGWPVDWLSTTEGSEAEGARRPGREAVGGLGWPVEGPAGLGWTEEPGASDGSDVPPPTESDDANRDGGAPSTSALSVDHAAVPRASASVEVGGDEIPAANAINGAAAVVSRETPEDAEPPPTAGVQSNAPVVFSPTLPRPVQTRIFVVANQKGGVGKTTTAVNLAAALAGSGARVLVVDLDPQGNASTALGIDHTEGVPNIYDVIVEGEPMRKFVHPVRRFPTLFGVPATIDLSGAELELASVVAREARLKKFLDAYLDEQAAAGERYDYVLIDCPPSLGLLTMNALVAGREVLVPIQCEYYALEGVETLFRIVNLVRELNRTLQVTTVILTMYDARTRLSAQVAENARESLGSTVLRSAIPRSVRISEAPSFGQTVMTWDAGSPGALSYLEAARELALRDPAAPGAAGAHRATAAPDVSRQDVLGSATATGVDRGELR
jgi:chromosome partitioning protein